MTPEDIAALDARDVATMPYPRLVALVGEVNRCPGGARTVRRLVEVTRPQPGSRILEVGCSTGFTSIELAAITQAEIIGIDLEPAAVAAARRTRDELPRGMRERLRFEVADVLDAAEPEPGPLLPAEGFDVVFTQGATSFVADKQRAVAAYRRLVRPFGSVCASPLLYREEPPPGVLAAVQEVLGVTLDLRSEVDWLRLFHAAGMELHHLERHELAARPPEVVDAHVDRLLASPRLSVLAPAAAAALGERWRGAMHAFNDNHRYLGFLVVVLRASGPHSQPELFVEPGHTDWLTLEVEHGWPSPPDSPRPPR